MMRTLTLSQERLKTGALYGVAVGVMCAVRTVPFWVGARHSPELERAGNLASYFAISTLGTIVASVLSGVVTYAIRGQRDDSPRARVLSNGIGGAIGSATVFSVLHELRPSIYAFELAVSFGIVWLISDLLFESARRQEF